jgi:hypothetical protein
LNEANKTANKAKLTTKKAENIVRKGKQDLKEIKNKDKAKAGKKLINLLEIPKIQRITQQTMAYCRTY